MVFYPTFYYLWHLRNPWKSASVRDKSSWQMVAENNKTLFLVGYGQHASYNVAERVSAKKYTV
jgi:hypothetical protein